MDPINSIAGNPTAVDNIPETPQSPQSPKDNHGIMIASMAIFVILALSAVAFLYYQNQQLKSMLASYQTPVASPTPTATADPTADWQTYVGSNFTFKYPAEYSLEKLDDKVLIRIDPPKLETVEGICPRYIAFSTISKDFVAKTTKNKYSCVYETIIKNENVAIESQYYEGQNDMNLKILSTFKFIEKQTPIGTGIEIGISCQQSGKIYKNGESVPSGDKCNTCSCENGQVACTLIACP